MSTEIKTMKGSCHYHPRRDSFDVQHKDADLYITRFFNGKDRGANIQLSIAQNGGDEGSSYIHLTKNQCDELAKVLLECFDREIYPSD